MTSSLIIFVSLNLELRSLRVISGPYFLLEFVLNEGKAAGLDEKELSSAQTVLAEEERKIAARDELAAAVESREIDSLTDAIKEARQIIKTSVFYLVFLFH